MNDEFVVAVLMETFHAGTIAANAVHAGRGIACKLDPFWFKGMELRMDHGARKWNGVPARSIEASCD